MRFRPIVSLLLLAAYLPACTSYRSTARPVADLAAAPESARQVRVITTTGARVELWSAYVARDTLWGYDGASGEIRRDAFVPMAEVGRMQILKPDPLKIGGALIGVGVIAATIALRAGMGSIGSGAAQSN